ncbi:MAG TPA: hypothetical protein PL033_04455 [Candidatus Brocadiia bacterium]|nr:hypothetical protein [Candidatus Brocadiia bacterium]
MSDRPETPLEENPVRGPRVGEGVRIALLVLLAAVAFLPSLNCAFVGWDDADLVLNCTEVRSLSAGNLSRVLAAPVAGAYLPVRTISYAIDYTVAGGYRPFWFHFHSVALHLLGLLVCYELVRRLAGGGAALAAGALFALHPTRVEGVAWISGRKEVLVTLFCLSSALCFAVSAGMGAGRGKAPGRNARSAWHIAALGLAVLALMSKATAVVMPLWLVLMDFCFESRLSRMKPFDRAMRHAPFFLAAGLFAYVHFLMGAASDTIRTPGGYDPARQLTLAALTPWWSLKLLLWPVNLGALYHPEIPDSPAAPRVLLALAGCATLAGAGVWLLVRRERRAWAFGYWWLFLGMLPTANIIPTSTPVADRYLHLPGFGFAFICALALNRCRITGREGWMPRAGGALMALSYSALTFVQCGTWSDSLSLWRKCLDAEPRNPLALANYALAQDALAGRPAYAERIARQAVEMAPDVEFPLVVLAQMQAKRDNAVGAIVSYSKALVINPRSRKATIGLASLYLKLNARRMAAGVCLRCIEADPRGATDPEILRLLSLSGYSAPAGKKSGR